MTDTQLVIDSDISLQIVTQAHTSEFFSLINRSRTYLREWLGWLDFTQTESDLEKFIEGSRREFAEKRGYPMWILNQKKVVGMAHLKDVDLTNRKAMIGYWVGQEYRGRGFAKKACKALCNFGFKELKLNRLEVRCATGNAASQAVPIALGFQREGVLRDHEWLYDHFVDHMIFSMLAREWNENSNEI